MLGIKQSVIVVTHVESSCDPIPSERVVSRNNEEKFNSAAKWRCTISRNEQKRKSTQKKSEAKREYHMT